MSRHPRRLDGSYIRESISPSAYNFELKLFQKIERTLGSIHAKGNSIKYELIQPLFGWVSDATKAAKVKFLDISSKGVMDPLTLYIIDESKVVTGHRYHADMKHFLHIIDSIKPSDSHHLKIITKVL